jgi:hypothetical protein
MLRTLLAGAFIYPAATGPIAISWSGFPGIVTSNITSPSRRPIPRPSAGFVINVEDQSSNWSCWLDVRIRNKKQAFPAIGNRLKNHQIFAREAELDADFLSWLK